MNNDTFWIGNPTTLGYNGKPIGAEMVNGVPWYSLYDLAQALRWSDEDVEKATNGSVPTFAALVKDSPVEEVYRDSKVKAHSRLVYLSPVGVLFWTCAVNRWKGQNITAWAKREGEFWCPQPPEGDRSLTLTIVVGDDGIKRLPPNPAKYSGWKRDYEELRYSKTWMDAEGENIVALSKHPLDKRLTPCVRLRPLGI